jgi:hypothetical protein
LYRLLKKMLGDRVTELMVRYTLWRHKLSGKYRISAFRRRRRYYDFRGLYPLRYFQVDVKEILDGSALSGR